MAKTYQLDLGVLNDLLTQEEIAQITPALYFTYRHLTTGKTNMENYKTMTTDHFWRLIEHPVGSTASKLGNILTGVDSESFVVQFRRIGNSGVNKDKRGFLKNQVYNSKNTDFNIHPEIKGSNILITTEDLALGGNLEENPLLKQKIYSIVYYMVKYQAFIIIKEESSQSKECILAGTLTQLFNLDHVKSLTSDGSWGDLILTEDAEENYNAWQENWNEENLWNPLNAYIPFYLMTDYKSGAESFQDEDGNLLGEGRLKELFLSVLGIDVEHLTSELSART
jgi:hypothetical protein